MRTNPEMFPPLTSSLNQSRCLPSFYLIFPTSICIIRIFLPFANKVNAGGNRADSILFTQRGIVRVIEYFFKNTASRDLFPFPNIFEIVYDFPSGIILDDNDIGIIRCSGRN